MFAELLLGRAGETEIVCASGRYDLGDISNLGNNREVVLLALLIDITGFCESSDQVIVHARRKSFVQFAELGDSGNGACAILTSDFQAPDDGAHESGELFRLFLEKPVRGREGALGVFHLFAEKHDVLHALVQGGIAFFRANNGRIDGAR